MTSASVPPGSTAIVGMAGRFPGAADIAAFWSLLREGRDGVRRLSRDELIAAGLPASLVDHPDYVPAKGLIEEGDCFDAEFFGIAPREAAYLDPQHRWFLQSCWHALEDAGCDPATFKGWIGVFAGEAEQSHQAALLARTRDVVEAAQSTPIFFGNSPDFLATRVSYKLDLRGPSLTVQTACSTSLVAVHLACQSLLTFESDLALAGGVSISTPNAEGYRFAHGSVESPDGCCRPFDADAAGTLPSNGVGVVALKRVEDALEAGDRIYALIRGTAINNDGGRKVGFTAPSIQGQADVLTLARKVAGIDSAEIGFIEAHGTGTVMGDPIEIAALAEAFGPAEPGAPRCWIGSLKSNVGHLKAAAGVAGLIKAALALHHREIPPTLHYRSANPKLELGRTRFAINDRLEPWTSDRARLAAVSSFGIGGTNAHAVLQEAPAPVVRAATNEQPLILPLSAPDDDVADAMVRRLSAALSASQPPDITDVAFTLQTRRRHFPRRRAIVAATTSEARDICNGNGAVITSRVGATKRPLCFMFPGQGAEFIGMGRGLLRTEPLFKEVVDRCAATVQRLTGTEIRQVIENGRVDTAALGDTRWTQPALFVIEYALSRLLMHWGLVPACLIGHSIGELTAACLAGVMSEDAALALVVARGEAMQASPDGAMLAVALSEAGIGELGPDLRLAAVNAATQCVISGTPEAIEQQDARWRAMGVQTRKLPAGRAFHSHLLEPALDTFRSTLSQTPLAAPRIPIASNVHGGWLSNGEACDPAYWIRQALSPVRFLDGLASVLAQQPHILIEVGPGRTLGGFARRHAARTPDTEIVAVLPQPSSADIDETRATYTALAELYAQGCELDWQAFNEGRQRQPVSLPPYPFRATRYAVDMIADLARSTPPPPAGRPSASGEILFVPAWERRPRRVPDALDGTTWIVGDPEGDLTRTIAAAVGRAGGRLMQVSAAADRDELTAHLRAGVPDRIVHLALRQEVSGDARERGYQSLLRIGAALGAANVAALIDLIVLARDVFAVDNADRPDPEVALMLGPAIVLGQEQPNVTVRIIDVGRDVRDTAVVTACAASGASVSALRGDRVLERSFRPVGSIDHTAKLDGHYLITGGLGRLGLTVARELASRHGARLSLLGRSVPNDIASRLDGITTHGGSAQTFSCDVTDIDALAKTVSVAEATFGPLDGVIHMAAETRAFASIPDTDGARSKRMLAAKVAGVQALDNVLGRRELSVRILMSSLASLLGGLGFSSYAAANAWLDAYAERDGRWASLCWDAWSEGLKADDVASAGYALTTSQAIDAIERVVAGGLTGQLVVCGGDLDERLARWTALARQATTANDAIFDDATDRAHGIRDIFAEVLGRSDLPHDGDFFDLGGDSLQAIQVVSRLRLRFALPVTPDLLFAHTTPVQLAAALDHLAAAQPPGAATPAVDLVRPVSEEARRMVEVMSGDEVNRMLERLLAEGQPT
ncbi:Putative Non-ribosomal peptide synthetase/polyketide synthase [Bradyrhizobium sp. ORS 285]|uniref:type I polyketide synthase n=1 Tax=Bradyrhizobium sp. ORS 285 TaxID=115808 RepID=UPI0002406C9F|nr:type I polyketide synthase [Bradyrhizobium sp. ORS 285]CCD83730.1 putative Non-ribosomal peptide synthetase/polyketide synthase [Bradyrhizobium sp. ORS 285]SMX59276.1 Putative Non-ribosomal peptide synthetase/polyketide synthase [Bradyrhizobium sp. ORS 285]